MNKTYLQCFFSLHLCPCLVVSFCKLRLKMINFPILCPVFFFLLTSQPLSSKVELFTSTLDHTPHLIITTISSVKPGRGALKKRQMYRRGLQALTLFWTKVLHFATLFKTRQTIIIPQMQTTYCQPQSAVNTVNSCFTETLTRSMPSYTKKLRFE